MNFSCFVLSRTTPTSALLKPDERFGFDLQCQLHLRAGASLQFRHDRVQDGVKRLCEAASAALADRSVLSGPRRGRPPGPAGPGASAPGPPPTPIKPGRRHGSVGTDINRTFSRVSVKELRNSGHRTWPRPNARGPETSLFNGIARRLRALKAEAIRDVK